MDCLLLPGEIVIFPCFMVVRQRSVSGHLFPPRNKLSRSLLFALLVIVLDNLPSSSLPSTIIIIRNYCLKLYVLFGENLDRFLWKFRSDWCYWVGLII